jgi:molybdate transport system regulatory protein
MGGRSAKIRHPETIGLHVRVVLSRGVALGPGRVELLRLVGELGSIAAAGRAMDMSYKRAWTLLDATAKAFGAPVVVSGNRREGRGRRGGRTRGASETSGGRELD